MSVIIPVASGKGGVGKSLTSVNLSIALASMGKAVILLDADLGGSNAHTFLGIKNKNPGLGSIIHRKEKHLEDLLVSTRFDRLFLIPGDGQFTGTTNPPIWAKRRIEKELPSLVADFILLDLGAGVNTFTLDMFLLSRKGIIVTTPEIPALLNGYNFIKHAVIRIFQQHTKSNTPEGKLANNLHARTLDNTSGIGLYGIIEHIRKENPEAAGLIQEDLKSFTPHVVLNMGTHQKDLAIGSNISRACSRHLEIQADYLGFIPWYGAMRNCINSQTSVFEEPAAAALSRAYKRLAQNIIKLESVASNRTTPLSHSELIDGLLESEYEQEGA